MAELSGYQILIVDSHSKNACHLRDMLVTRGARVHAFSSPQAALVMVQQNHIDGAFIQYYAAGPTRLLCTHLCRLDIPIIFIPSDIELPLEESSTRLDENLPDA
jgi:PleD family two-component response regulator